MTSTKRFDSFSNPEFINNTLKPSDKKIGLALDLFAGCGGLALGFEAQGFETIGYEMDIDCCQTYNKNLSGKCINTILTPDYKFPDADIIIGGPPCQPFSVIGNQNGSNDPRDGFPTFISAIKQIKPKIWMFENVRGTQYKNKDYFDSIILQLSKIGYTIEIKLLNAVDYGVPQRRERIFAVGHKGDFRFPEGQKAHVTAGEAIAEFSESTPPESKFLTPSQDEYIAKYEKASCCINPRDLHLSKSSRTLTCRNLAAATGDMLRVKLPDGRRRRLLIREAARLQSFPDYFEFCGTEESIFYQIGNAVPPLLSYKLAESIKKYLQNPVTKTRKIESKRIAIQKYLEEETPV